ncbi:MAG: UDP-2,3-diacylglucosamine diphosphatase [Bacteroidota bacterium]
MNSTKRKVDLVIISDAHLGLFGAQATELLHYLKSIEPGRLVINGDLVDMWQFNKLLWPKSHMKVIKYIISMIERGVRVHFLPGNHDEMLRNFVGFRMGTLSIENQLVLELEGGEKAWIFHGDVFDVTMKGSKVMARVGAFCYDMMTGFDLMFNYMLRRKGRRQIFLSKKLKDWVKKMVNSASKFEETAARRAQEHGYDYVVVGHIHKPEMREIALESGSVHYLNSGDWIVNLTALEYHAGAWSLFRYFEDMPERQIPAEVEEMGEIVMSGSRLFEMMTREFEEESEVIRVEG